MKGLSALRQLGEIPMLQRLRKGVEQTPDVPVCEDFMQRLTPLFQHARDVAIGAHTHIDAANDEIMSLGVIHRGTLVGFDSLILVMPLFHEETDGAFDELRQIPIDESGVLAGELNLTAEAEVIADEHQRTGDDARREHLVVRIPKAKHPAVIFAGFAAVDFHQAEVSSAVMSEAVGLARNGEPGRCQGPLNGLDELMMWDRLPRRGCPRRFHRSHGVQIYSSCPAVEDEVGLVSGFWGRSRFEEINHWNSPFCFG